MVSKKKAEEEVAAEGTGTDYEEQTTSAIDRMERLADDLEFSPDTLIADLRDGMLEIFKHRPRPWSQLSQAEQRDVATAIEAAARKMTAKAVVAIASQGQTSIKAKFEGYKDKEGSLSGTIKFFTVTDEDVLSLHRASGKSVLLVTADANDYDNQRSAATDRDDPELTFAESPLDIPDDDSDLAGEERAALEAPETEDVE